MVITFVGALRQALSYCMRLNEELFQLLKALAAAGGDTKHHPSRSWQFTEQSCVVSTARHIFFITIIHGCLKYKNKERPKSGPARVWAMMWKLAHSPALGP